MRCVRKLCLRTKARRDAAKTDHGFGPHPPPKLQAERAPLTGFSGRGGLSFDEVVAALKDGYSPIVVTLALATRSLRGEAFAVDESGIVRIGQAGKPGVRMLVFQQGDTLYGEFT